MLTVTNFLPVGSSPSNIFRSSSEDLLYLCSEEGIVYTIDVVKNDIIDSFFIPPSTNSFSFDGVNERFFFSSSTTGSLSVYEKDNSNNFVEKITRDIPGTPSNLFIDIDRQILFIFCKESVVQYDIANNVFLTSGNLTFATSGGTIDEQAQITTTTPAPTPNTYLYFLSKEEDTLSRYNLSTQSIDVVIPVGLRPESFVISKGFMYVSNYYSEFISVIDLSNNTTSTIDTYRGVADLAFDSDHDLLYILNNLYDICYVVDVNTNEIVSEIKTQELSTSIIINEGFGEAYICSEKSSGISVVNIYDFSIQFIPLSFRPTSIVLNKTSKTLYIADFRNGNLFAMSIIERVPFKINSVTVLPINELFIDPYDRYLFALNQSSDMITVFDTFNNKEVITLRTDNSPSSIAFDSINNNLYVSHTLDNVISPYDGKTFRRFTSFSTGSMPDHVHFHDMNTTTTTTTTAPSYTTTLTIPVDSNSVIETHVIFYGDSGDEIGYTYIEADDLSTPITFNEILIEENGVVVNRLTIPQEYVDQNISFTITTGGSTYTSSFGSGTIELDSYRRIQFP
jgi:hypothetical protein